MKIALLFATLLSIMLVIIGATIWYLNYPFIIRLILSGLCIVSGVTFAVIGIDLFLEDL